MASSETAPGPSFTADEGTFIGFITEAVLYGIYVVLFSMAMYVLVWTRRGPVSKIMVSVTVFLFSLCTVHFAIQFANAYQALMLHPGNSISTETPLLRAGDILLSITDFTAELVLIYRLWLVWGRNYYIAILPFLMSLAAIASYMAVTGIVAQIDPSASLAPTIVVPLGTASFALSLAVNFLTTSLIIGRIWYMARGTSITRRDRNDAVRIATGVIIESGALFFMFQLLFVVLFAIQHPAQAVAIEMCIQIYGIAPTLIIVRIGLGSSFDQTTMRKSTIRFMSAPPNGVATVDNGGTNTMHSVEKSPTSKRDFFGSTTFSHTNDSIELEDV